MTVTDMAIPRQLRARLRKTRRRLGFNRRSRRSVRIEEASGVRVSISSDLPHAADHATSVFEKRYLYWRDTGRFTDWGQYKRRHFTVAVGGGNTIKAQYQAMVDRLYDRVDWMAHVRFFFLEDSTGEGKWESPEHSLVMYFITPLARKLVVAHGLRNLARDMGLENGADEHAVIDALVEAMVNPINMAEAK